MIGEIIQLWQLAGAHSPCSAGPAAGIFLLSRESVNLLLATPWLDTILSWRLKQKKTDCSESKKSSFLSLGTLHKYFHICVCAGKGLLRLWFKAHCSKYSIIREWNLRITETLNSEVFHWNFLVLNNAKMKLFFLMCLNLQSEDK